MSTTIGRVVFNPAPGAAAPSTGNSTETVMMSYGGGLSPKQMLARIAALEREIAELRLSSTTLQHLLDAEKTLRAFDAANFAELEQISGDNIGELVFTQFENERFRAHIQEAADDAKSNEMASAVNGECYQVKYFNKLRDWHLAALQPKEPTK